MKSLRLGLIGDNIARSQSPRLHRLAGELTGIDVTYDRLIPRDLGRSFEEVFADCAASGRRGVNVTYPYKETAARMVRIDDPLVRAIGAVNTVLFEPDGPVGRNTDHSGFMAAHRTVRGETPPGRVLMIGAGGVGRAVAFGLIALGASEIRLLDREPEKAEALADALRAAGGATAVSVHADPAAAANGAEGLVNCTPVGMVGYDGTPLPRELMAAPEWAFDAVYTPADTQFLRDAEAAGAKIISGWELFFNQGVHAWGHFAGAPLDEAKLRAMLLEPEEVG